MKVVIAKIVKKTSNGLKTNCKYVACGGWETGSSLEVSWKPDRSLTAHTTINRQVNIKLSFMSCCLSQNCVVNGISSKGNKKWKRNGMIEQKAKKM